MTKAKLIVADSVRNSDLLWATQFHAGDNFIFLEHEGIRSIVVSDLEYERAKTEARVQNVFRDADLHIEKKACGRILGLLKKMGVTECAISPNMPAATYCELKEAGIDMEFIEPMFPERKIKTAEEIEDIRYAQMVCEKGFAAILKTLGEAKITRGQIYFLGTLLTSEILRKIFEMECLKYECVCESTIVACGDEAVKPHSVGKGAVLPNSLIICDLYPRSKKKWYWSDMSRTIVKGKASSEAKKIYGAVYEAQMRGLEMVHPGIEASDIHSWICNFFKEKNYATGIANGIMQGFIHGTGHGVGLDIHELPWIGNAQNQILEEGNVITIEPGLYYQGIGGVRIEDTVLVTKDGHENLATIRKDLIEIL